MRPTRDRRLLTWGGGDDGCVSNGTCSGDSDRSYASGGGDMSEGERSHSARGGDT